MSSRVTTAGPLSATRWRNTDAASYKVNRRLCRLSPVAGTDRPVRSAMTSDSWDTSRAGPAQARRSCSSSKVEATLSRTWVHGQNAGAPDAAGARPEWTGRLRRRAIASSASMSVVLPMPGSPATNTRAPWPVNVRRSSWSWTMASSRPRPTMPSAGIAPPTAAGEECARGVARPGSGPEGSGFAGSVGRSVRDPVPGSAAPGRP